MAKTYDVKKKKYVGEEKGDVLSSTKESQQTHGIEVVSSGGGYSLGISTSYINNKINEISVDIKNNDKEASIGLYTIKVSSLDLKDMGSLRELRDKIGELLKIHEHHEFFNGQ